MVCVSRVHILGIQWPELPQRSEEGTKEENSSFPRKDHATFLSVLGSAHSVPPCPDPSSFPGCSLPFLPEAVWPLWYLVKATAEGWR